jgi:stage V sporulation protein B
MNILDAIIIKSRLVSAGYSSEAATSLYGQLSGFVSPLINFPQVLTAALAMSLVPFISSAWKRKDTYQLTTNTALAVRIALIVGLPCAFGLAVLSKPIMMLLFSYGDEAGAMSAAPTLAVMAFGVIFLSITQTVTGILQGVDKQSVPVKNLAIGVVIKVGLTWILTGIYALNVRGAALATVITYAIVAFLEIKATKKYTKVQIDWNLTFVRPFISTLVMTAVAYGSYILFKQFIDLRIACVAAILLAILVYVVMMFVTKSITREECAAMPGGNKLVGIIDRFSRK